MQPFTRSECLFSVCPTPHLCEHACALCADTDAKIEREIKRRMARSNAQAEEAMVREIYGASANETVGQE